MRLVSSSDVPTAPECKYSPMFQMVLLLLPCIRQAEWELWLKEKSLYTTGHALRNRPSLKNAVKNNMSRKYFETGVIYK